MVARPERREDRVVMALNLELSDGRHGASARVELRERHAGRLVLLAVRGWLDGPAVQRLGHALDAFSEPGIEQLLLDCSQVRHIDYRAVPRLVDALARFESHAGGFVVCGLTPYLRDLFRLAGCEARLRCWPSAADLLVVPAACETGRECAS